MKTHPTDLHLEALYLELEQDHREVLDHLTACARCRERTANLRPAETSASDMPESPGEPPDPHIAEEAHRTWGFVEWLVTWSLEATLQDPENAEKLGRFAYIASSLLDSGLYGAEGIEDLCARAWSRIANARRVRSDFDGAEQGFSKAREHLQRGTQNPVETALVLDFEGSLRRAQRQFGKAVHLFNSAASIFLEHGDLHRSGRSLFKLSTVQYFTGDLDEAIATLRRSLESLDQS